MSSSHTPNFYIRKFCCSQRSPRFFSSDLSLPLKIIEVTTSTFLVELLQTMSNRITPCYQGIIVYSLLIQMKIHGGIKELLVLICKTQALGVFQQ